MTAQANAYCELVTRNEVYAYVYSAHSSWDTKQLCWEFDKQVSFVLQNNKPNKLVHSHTYNVFMHKNVQYHRLYTVLENQVKIEQ